MNKVLIVVLLFLMSLHVYGRHSISSSRYELLSGNKRNKKSQQFWDRKYSSGKYIYGKAPAKFLAKNYDYIPSQSNVLDIGMGEGRNAVFLARKGYRVTGVDISSVAVRKARMLAREFGVRINGVISSLNNYKVKPGSLDAIVCFYFVKREFNSTLISWLKPGGILIFEAYTDLQMNNSDNAQHDRNFLLRQRELLTMFKGMTILKYEEPFHKKDFSASIILQKPKNEN